MGNAFSDTDFEDSTRGELTVRDDWSKSAAGFTERDGLNSSAEESAYNLATFDTREESVDGRKVGARGEDYDYAYGTEVRQASPVRIKRQSPAENNRNVDSSDTGDQGGWETTEDKFDGYESRNLPVKKHSPTSPILAQIRSENPADQARLIRQGSSYDDDDYESWYNDLKDRYKTGWSPISLASRFWTTISGTDDEDEEGVEATLKPRFRSPPRSRQNRRVLSPSNRSPTNRSHNFSPVSKIWTTVDGDDEDDEGVETTLRFRKKSPRKSPAQQDRSENEWSEPLQLPGSKHLRKSDALADSSENEWSGSLKSSGTKDPPARERSTGIRSPKSTREDHRSDRAMKDLIETFARELAKNIAREGTPSNFNIFEEINKRVAQSTQSPKSTIAGATKATPNAKANSSTTDIGKEVEKRLDEISPRAMDVGKETVASPKIEKGSEQTESTDGKMPQAQAQDKRHEENASQDMVVQEDKAVSPVSKFSLKSLASLVTAPTTPAVDKSQPTGSIPAVPVSAQAPVNQTAPVVETIEVSAQRPVTQTAPRVEMNKAPAPVAKTTSEVQTNEAPIPIAQPTPTVQMSESTRQAPAQTFVQAPMPTHAPTPAQALLPTPVQAPIAENQPQEATTTNENVEQDESEVDELVISPAASALEVVRAASPLVTLTSEDFEDVDMKFVQQYDGAFETFVEAHPSLCQENVDMIMYLRVAKLQKLLECVDDLEDVFQEKLEKLRMQKKVMTCNYQRELLNATKEKAGREIHLRQELRMLRETTQLLEAKLKWEVFLKHKSRADGQFDLLQQLWMKTVNPDDPISALPESMAMQEIRDAAAVVKPEKDEADDKSTTVDMTSGKASVTAASAEQQEVTKLELEVASVALSENEAKPKEKEGEELPLNTDANKKVDATPVGNDMENEEANATKKEMKEVQMDNAFLNAEISVLESKLAYVKSKSHKDMWVDTMFHQLGSAELARFKKKFEEDVGVPV